MKDVEKFEKFEEMKKSEENKNQISENTQEMVEEFIQLLIRNSRNDENPLRFTKVQSMYSDFTEHILKICKTLNTNNVQFIIVGGTAAGFHQETRGGMNLSSMKWCLRSVDYRIRFHRRFSRQPN